MNLKEQLVTMRACPEAIEWVGDRDIATVWADCERPDWMLWYAGRIIDRRLLVKTACAIARRVLQYIPAEEIRPRIAIETAEAWTEGKATRKEVRDAAYAAADAANAADAAHAATYAADAAAYATYAAYAAYAADAATYAAEQREQCAIIRDMIPVELLSRGEGEG